MSLSLHTIKKASGTTKKRKRIGRGNASGTGTYSGKGLKGQKSRSGVSNLKRLGMRQTLLRTPKKRGFRSLQPKDQVINVIDINKFFKEGEEVNPKILLKKGLIDNTDLRVKLLGKGELTVKGLQFSEIRASENVKAQIEKLGGKFTPIVIVPNKAVKPKKGKK
ncbi:MAG: 50S ribosomal protein L15 [Candidatus Magasanikbacteria bacterium]|nr:50S ribosomal protein L15 [Candidatus Magasanikbacteria bacterium]